jgi:putative flippase GtrA
MVDQLRKNTESVRKHGGLWLFLKAQLSAQVASIVDFCSTVFLVKFFGIYYLYATFTGSVAGGVVNCAINYGWVFHAEDCKKTHVAFKYFLVWSGSILLNTWGTFILTEWFTGMKLINHLLGYYVNDLFMLSKVIVSLLVGFFWNYCLQRFFVYRNHNIKEFFKNHIEIKHRRK